VCRLKDVHKFLSHEKKMMGKIQSHSYQTPNSVLFRKWKAKQPPSNQSLKWCLFGLVGCLVGLVSFLLKNFVEKIAEMRSEIVAEALRKEDTLTALAYSVGLTTGLALMSSLSVVLIEPAASGSGIPEVIGYLNGSHLGKVLNLKTLVVKFISCVLAVSSGMAVGPEGPMIHMGSMIGAGVGAMRSKTLGLDVSWLGHFRDSASRRDFVTCGAGAGVAAAFGAPVGGLLFVMEELASFWSQKLAWMIFFGCMMAVSVSDLFNSTFHAFDYTHKLGYFELDATIIFKVRGILQMNIMAVLPAIFLGVIGGLAGTVSCTRRVNFDSRDLMSPVSDSTFPDLRSCIHPLCSCSLSSISRWYVSVVRLVAAFWCCTRQLCSSSDAAFFACRSLW
jgi:chloride channel 7